MNVTEALGWALLHSLWQCTLVGAALASLLAIIPARAARTRYALAVTTLILMLAVPVATAVRLRAAAPSVGARAALPTPTAPASIAVRTAAASPAPAPATRSFEVSRASLATHIRADLEPALPWIVVAWLAGVVILSIRLVSGWVVTRVLSRVGTRPVPQACRDALARLVVRLRVTRPVRVLESALVQVPAVIGWLRPIVLLPASALTGLTPLQLDALLAHELAHVRRYDYLVHLIQSMIETLLFYHPAVWWVSRRVREAREHCCDDLAVAVCGDARIYAMALFSLERLRASQPAFALGVNGGGSLLRRIRRLIAPAGPEVFA